MLDTRRKEVAQAFGGKQFGTNALGSPQLNIAGAV
jgi:hypothetical protein